MYSKLLFLLFLFFSFSASTKVCKIPLIKSYDDLKEKIKICDRGDKLYIQYDMKIIGEELIVSLCSLKDTVIFKEEAKIIHKRKSGASIICIFKPDTDLLN